MKLSKRLQIIADFVLPNSVVADIGTDHGYIPAFLIHKGISKKVIGSDISKGSLDKIIEYVKQLHFEDKIDTRLGNGLEVIKPFEVDTVIIAGMGGILMRDILDKDHNITNSITNFIFQPMVGSKELRNYLINNQFVILDEELVKEDNKYYEIIYARRGIGTVEKEIDYEISPILIQKNHPLLREFLSFKIQSAEIIKDGLCDKKSEKSLLRYAELNKTIDLYKEVLNCIES